MHLAVGTKAHAFILWAENYKLNPECYEVRALQFIPNHVEVAGKIVARVMWALVYSMMGEHHPVPNRIVGLEGTGPHQQSPAGAAFPTRPEEQHDLRIRARDGWEWIFPIDEGDNRPVARSQLCITVKQCFNCGILG